MTTRPDDFRDLEAALRDALREDAGRIAPTDRLTAIQRSTVRPIAVRRRGPSLIAMLGAAAAAAVVVTFAASNWLPRDNQALPADTPTSSIAASTLSQSAPTGPNAALTPPAGSALPMYYLAPITPEVAGTAPPVPTLRLHRTFIANPEPAATPDVRVAAAVGAAMEQGIWNTANRPVPWAGTTLVGAEVADGLITLTLSGGGSTAEVPNGPGALAPADQRLAIQQLVWTAQAAAGMDRLPVTFRLADGASRLFGRYPAAERYDRPDTADLAAEIGPVWIDSPGLDASYAEGTPVVLAGLSLLPASALRWDVQETGGGDASTGNVAATGDAPGGVQHGYQATLPVLPAGSYRLTVSGVDPETGRSAMARILFTIS